jgi:hypothetical protein
MGMSGGAGARRACPQHDPHTDTIHTKKVAAPEGTATFKLQTAWPQGAHSVRNAGN